MDRTGDWKMVKILKDSSTWKYAFNIAVMFICAMLTIMVSNSRAIDDKQDDRINYKHDAVMLVVKEHCAETKEDLSKKVDNQHFDTVLKIIIEQQNEDKEFRKETVKAMQEVQIKLGIIEGKIK